MSKVIPNFRNTNAKTTQAKLKGSQIPDRFLEVIGVQIDEYNGGLNITAVGEIPDTKNIPIDDQHWIKIPDVACVSVNMASKLASLAEAGALLVSDRYYDRITNDHARLSCGCPGGRKVSLWSPVDVSSNAMFDFDVAWRLTSKWCETHGSEFCENILSLERAKAKAA